MSFFQEYSQLAAFAIAGCSLGTVLVFPLGGVLASILGWRAVFYCTGGLNLLVSLLWWAFVYDRPDLHPRMSREEKKHIENSQAASGAGFVMAVVVAALVLLVLLRCCFVILSVF